MIEDFLTYLRVNRNRSDATVTEYRRSLKRLDVYLKAEGKDLLRVRTQDLEVWSGPHLHKEGLDAASRSKAISAVRGFFKWAERLGYVDRSPAMALDHPKLPSRIPGAWSLEQAEALIWAPDLSTFKGVRDAAMLAFLIGTGCRVSGLVGLNEQDIYTDTIDGERWVFALLREKGKKERQIPLSRLTVVPLLMYLGHEERLALDNSQYHLRIDAGRVLFCNLKPGETPLHEWNGEKRRLTQQGVRRVVKWYGRQAGIPENLLHPHAGRHLMGTHLFDEGIDKESRKALLGHERDETLSIYTRMSRKRLLPIAGKANPLEAIRTPFDELAEVAAGPLPASMRPRR